jgi:hypothetical protein
MLTPYTILYIGAIFDLGAIVAISPPKSQAGAGTDFGENDVLYIHPAVNQEGSPLVKRNTVHI